jgi:hypothetical protein
MGNLHKLIRTIALALIAGSIATPAAATKVDEAVALCRQRGPDCHGMRVKSDGSTVTTILCVNNSSSGQGVQCVQCPPSGDCVAVRIVPKTRNGGLVVGILNNNRIDRRRSTR